jgi:hypothetical protein
VAIISLLGAVGAVVQERRFAQVASAGSGAAVGAPTPPTATLGPAGATLIEFLSPIVASGGAFTIRVIAPPDATCTLALIGAQGESLKVPDAGPMRTDAAGRAEQTAHVDPGLAPGMYHIFVVCSPGTATTGSLTIT